jgi:RNA-binding protein
LKTCISPIREVALDINSGTKSEIVQVIGRTIVLFRASKKNIYQLPKDSK